MVFGIFSDAAAGVERVSVLPEVLQQGCGRPRAKQGSSLLPGKKQRFLVSIFGSFSSSPQFCGMKSFPLFSQRLESP